MYIKWKLSNSFFPQCRRRRYHFHRIRATGTTGVLPKTITIPLKNLCLSSTRLENEYSHLSVCLFAGPFASNWQPSRDFMFCAVPFGWMACPLSVLVVYTIYTCMFVTQMRWNGRSWKRNSFLMDNDWNNIFFSLDTQICWRVLSAHKFNVHNAHNDTQTFNLNTCFIFPLTSDRHTTSSRRPHENCLSHSIVYYGFCWACVRASRCYHHQCEKILIVLCVSFVSFQPYNP